MHKKIKSALTPAEAPIRLKDELSIPKTEENKIKNIPPVIIP
jgi:hypothetical protein